MSNQLKHLLILILVLALPIVGCQADATPAAQESANIEPTTETPSDGLRDPNTEAPTLVPPPTETSIPTETSVPTETSIPTETPLPTLTPFEIYWTVHPYEASTGELAYMVDQPEVLELAKQHFWELHAYFSWQDGLPSLEQLEADLQQLAVPGDEGTGAQVMITSVKETYEHGSYIRYTRPTEYTWRDDRIGFSPSGHLVILALEIPDDAQMGERVDIETGEVLDGGLWHGTLEKMTLEWDENLGRWLWVASAFDDLEE